MKTIYKRIFRELWKLRGRSLAIMISIGSVVAISTGIDMSIKSLFSTRDILCESMEFADLEIQLLPTDVNHLPTFSNINGIERVEKRLVFPGITLLDNNKRIPCVMVFLETIPPKIDSLKFLEGNYFNAGDTQSFMVEFTLAESHGLKVGDTIKVKVGEKIYENTITGVAMSPEYLTIMGNPEYFFPEKGTFGVVFANIRQISNALGFTMVNDLIFKFKKGVDEDVLKKEIVNHLANLNVVRVIPKREHFSYKSIEMDLNAFATFVPAFVIILSVLGIIVTYMVFNQLVHRQRKETGTFLALGYSRKNIFISYLWGGLTLGVIGCIGGLLFSLIVRNVFSSTYASAIGFPTCFYQLPPASIVKGGLLGLLLALFSSLMSPLMLLGRRPQEIIREPLKTGFIVGRGIRFLFERLSFLSIEYRIGLRNLFRRKRLTLSTVFCLALSIGVSTSYFMSVTSFNKTVEDTLAIEKWDMAVDFLYPIFEEDIERDINKMGNEKIREFEPFVRSYIEIGKMDKEKQTYSTLEDAVLVGIKKGSKLKDIHPIEGTIFSETSDREVIIGEDLKRELRAEVGDTLVIRKNGEYFRCSLVGITSEIFLRQSMVSFKKAREILGYLDEASGIFVKSALKPKKIKDNFYKMEYVGKVNRKGKLVETFKSYMDELMEIVYLAEMISIFVASLFIFNSIILSITESEAEFATLKSLGYGKKSLAKIIFSEVIAQGLIAALFSIPVGIGVSFYLNYRLGEAWFRIQNHVGMFDIAVVVIPALIFISLASYPGMRHIFRLNITETLRSKIVE